MTTPNSGEQFILIGDDQNRWSICNREGYIGYAPHPITALTLLQKLNRMILDHYNWSRNTQNWKLPITDPPKISAFVLLETIASAQKAWLN